MVNFSKLLPLSLVVLLSSCSSSGVKIPQKTLSLFDTVVTISSPTASEEDFSELTKILKKYDAVSDAYKQRDVINVYSWSHTEEKIYFGDEEGKAPFELFKLVKSSFKAVWDGARNIEFRLGSLYQKWKEAEQKGVLLEEDVIQEALTKRSNSWFTIHDDEDDPSEHYIVQGGVEAFDYGATAKGCALDACKEYLDTRKDLTDYIINAGSSSILLGSSTRNKNKSNPAYSIKIKELSNVSFYAHDCFVSTSGTSEQGVTINGVKYSHIINPKTGSAETNYDEVIVISDNGTYGDAFATSMMFDTVETIKELEEQVGLKTIVIKDKKIVYRHKDIVFK